MRRKTVKIIQEKPMRPQYLGGHSDMSFVSRDIMIILTNSVERYVWDIHLN